jgi:hypothetical protein
MRRILAHVTLATATAVALTACTGDPAPVASPASATAPSSSSSSSPTSATSSPTTTEDARSLIDALEVSPEARPLAAWQTVSVQDATLVTVSADGHEAEAPLPTGVRYVSIAPYVTQSHDCFWHNLATCRGELAGTTAHFTITADDGEVLADQEVPLGANGFAGFWLPADAAGTISVEQDGRTGAVPFTTTPGSPTCITTLQIG